MKSVTINGLSIRYQDINEECETALVFIHGNSHSRRSFKHQLESGFFSPYRLILLDLPGHGQSARSEAYSLPFFSEVVSQFVTTLNLQKYILVGHSLGGHIAIHTLRSLTPEGIFVFGTPPLKKPLDHSMFLASDCLGALTQEKVSDTEVENLLSVLQYTNQAREEAKSDYLLTDPLVRSGMLNSLIQANYEDETELLKTYQGHGAFLISTKDSFINGDYIRSIEVLQNRHHQIYQLESNHSPQVEQAEAFNNLLYKFIIQTLNSKPGLTTFQNTELTF